MRRAGHPLRAAVAALVAALAAAATGCGGPRATPESTWAAIQAAVASRDPRLLVELHDRDTVAHRRQILADWRVLLARGDPPEQVMHGTTMTVEDVTTGEPDEAIGRLFAKHSPLVRDAEFLRSAKLESVVADGPGAACLKLRGGADRTFDLWLVRERGGWAIDHRRTFSPR